MCCLSQLCLVPLLLCEVNVNLGGSHSHLLNKGEGRVACELSRQVEEGLLVVVVALC